MANNFERHSEYVETALTVPAYSGEPVQLPSGVVGIAADNYPIGEVGRFFVTGVWRLRKATGATAEAGAPVFWDSTNRQAVFSGGTFQCGIASKPGISGRGMVVVDVSRAGGSTDMAAVNAVTANLREVSIISYGAVGGNSAADTTALTNAINAAKTGGLAVYIPPGTYVINNAVAPFTVTGFSGLIYGPGTLSFTDLSKGGMVFDACNGMSLRDVAMRYGPTRTTRNGAQLLTIQNSSAVRLFGVRLMNGNSSAILVNQVNDLISTDMLVDGFKANGVFITNSTNIRYSGLDVANVEDGAFEVSTYNASPITQAADVFCSGLVTRNCWNGVLINSALRVTVSGFKIDSSSVLPAIIVLQDPGTTTTKWFDDIVIENGLITNAANGGIRYGCATAPTVDCRLTVRNVTMKNVTGRGLFYDPGVEASRVVLDVANVSVETCSDIGFRLRGKMVQFTGLTSIGCGAYGFIAEAPAPGSGAILRGRGLTIRNAQGGAGDPRAGFILNWTMVNILGLHVEDDRATPLGAAWSDNGVFTGNIQMLTSYIPNGTFVRTNNSAGLKYGALPAPA